MRPPPPLPRSLWQRVLVTMGRALTRRCPYCGANGIFRGYFALREVCPRCGTRFEREEGYFLGAYALNLIVALFLGLGFAVFVIFGTPLRDLDLIWQELIAVGLVAAIPILFFPYSRVIWIAMDLIFHPPGRRPERQLRGVQTTRSNDQDPEL